MQNLRSVFDSRLPVRNLIRSFREMPMGRPADVFANCVGVLPACNNLVMRLRENPTTANTGACFAHLRRTKLGAVGVAAESLVVAGAGLALLYKLTEGRS